MMSGRFYGMPLPNPTTYQSQLLGVASKHSKSVNTSI